MFRLVVISRASRGTKFNLSDGENGIGRHSANAIVLDSRRVSKQHCVLSVIGSQFFIKDLGSSNGTFVNGKFVREKELKLNDRISVGNFIFELTSFETIPAKNDLLLGIAQAAETPKQDAVLDPLRGPSVQALRLDQAATGPPKELVGKALWFLETRVMPYFYDWNQKQEWQMLFVGLIAVFLAGNLVISIMPMVQKNEESLIREIARRAQFMARQIADQNAAVIAGQEETKAEVGIAEKTPGVRTAMLLDLENRIIAPTNRLNQYLSSGLEASLAVRARDSFRVSGLETGLWRNLNGLVVAVEPVKIFNVRLGRNVVAAMALVSIESEQFIPASGELGVTYSQAFIFTALLAAFIFSILYRLILNPFNVLSEDLNKALKGEISEVTHAYKLVELDPLWDRINSVLQRIPTSNNQLSTLEGVGGSASYGALSGEDIASVIQILGPLCHFGLICVDSNRKILTINSVFEEISGMRSDLVLGQDVNEVAREQSFAAFVSDLLARSVVSSPQGLGEIAEEGSQNKSMQEEYEFSGTPYQVHVACFGKVGELAKSIVLALLPVGEEK